jgi:hypothetical protein
MLEQFRRAMNLVALKWKQGEARAISTVPRAVVGDLCVLFDMPPAGDFDHELGRVLEPTEHIKLFGARLEKHCGSNPVFIDAALVDDERHREGFVNHPLTELIERGRLAGSRPCPVTGLARTPEYQAAVARFVRDHPVMPLCLRLSASDLERSSLGVDLSTLLSDLKCDPARVIVVFDLGPRDLQESDLLPLTELIANRLNEMPMLHRWLNVAILMTSFPEKIPLKAGQLDRYPRFEWIVYQSLWNMRDRLLRWPIFGDYALEFPGRYLTGKAQPVAQFRYTTSADSLVVKGATTKKPNGYEAIRPVAKALVAEPEYIGPTFSQGDAFLDRQARGVGGPGNASTWRWAWTDHHLNMVWRDLRMLMGLPLGAEELRPTPEAMQLSLNFTASDEE